mmetsp:Transcript_11845/g.30358  ORF Transcript_11845/g.30358 Transcript_11845/m.30358 type:complete len:229 (+) Transcript_11845:105-791(+)
MEAIKEMFDGVQDKIDDFTEAVENKAHETLGHLFEPHLEKAVDSTLSWMGPASGEHSVDKMVEKFPKLEKFDSLQDQAKDAAVSAVMGMKDVIMAFVRDALHDPQSAFKKVGTMLLRAGHQACQRAIQVIKDLIPDCCEGLCFPKFDMMEIVTQVYTRIKEEMKTFLKGHIMSSGVPVVLTPVVDSLPWDFHEADEVGEPQEKKESSAPAPQEMGAPACEEEPMENQA